MPVCCDSFGRPRIIALCFVALFAAPPAAMAQYLGHDLRGDNGPSAGSQPFPGVYVAVPFYDYDIDSLRTNTGNENTSLPFPKMQGWGARAIVVTKAKIVGGRYGFALGPVFWMRDVIDVPRLGLHNTTGYAFFDTYYQPLMLGWTTKQADFIAGYGFFAQTENFDYVK